MRIFNHNILKRRALKIAAMLLLLPAGGCTISGPIIGHDDTVYTPIYRDNRIYFLGAADQKDVQTLTSLATKPKNDPNVIKPNSPLSIIVRSVEIPSKNKLILNGETFESPVTEPADYAVVLDIGTSSDGETQSIVVWYQRGVYPDQSLNFSNLLVYFEQRWDDRVAPFFHVRVIDVTKERNEETRRMLEQAHKVISAGAAISASPAVTPLAGVAFAAANLILANKKNRALVDYSVQLYSSNAAAEAGDSQLGVLRRGSYIVVGRPNETSREFWKQSFSYDAESRILSDDSGPLNVPTALISIGTFDSIVPKGVMTRSAALTKLLAQNGEDSSVEQIDASANRLRAGVKAFALAETLTRYRDAANVKDILASFDDPDFTAYLSEDDKYSLLRVISKCYKRASVFTLQEAKDFYDKNMDKPCDKP